MVTVSSTVFGDPEDLKLFVTARLVLAILGRLFALGCVVGEKRPVSVLTREDHRVRYHSTLRSAYGKKSVRSIVKSDFLMVQS